MNWKEHSLSSTVTLAGDLAIAFSRAGLAKCVKPLKIDTGVFGMYVMIASKRPAIMIGLRPILSDKLPKKIKNGVPITKEAAISRLAVLGSTFST